jgi:hypothetical protein
VEKPYSIYFEAPEDNSYYSFLLVISLFYRLCSNADSTFSHNLTNNGPDKTDSIPVPQPYMLSTGSFPLLIKYQYLLHSLF